MSVKVGTFFIDLAVDASSGNLSVKQLVGALGELDVASVASVTVISKISETLWGMARAATGTAVEMSVLKDITDVDPKIAQQWEKAAVRMNMSTGTMIRAIMSVHEMNRKIAAGEGTPAVISKLFGMDPTKVDAKGKRGLKDAMDYIREMASDESIYQQRGKLIQQTGLEQIFGGAGKDVFRMIAGLRSGEFKPSEISVLENEQVEKLTGLRKQEIEISQKMTGIFQKFLTGGDRFAKVLDLISGKLEDIDKWLASKQGGKTLNILGKEIMAPLKYNFNLWEMGKATGKYIGEQLLPRPPLIPSDVSNLQMGHNGLRGLININWNVNGKKVGETQVELDGSGVKGSFWDATEAMGNTK